MNRLAGAKQASFGETYCLLQNHVLWIKCSKTSDKPMILPWAIIANGWEMGLGHSNPCSEPRKVHRNQILVKQIEMEMQSISNKSLEEHRDPFPPYPSLQEHLAAIFEQCGSSP